MRHKQRQVDRAVVGIRSKLDDGHITSEMVSDVSQIEGGITKGSMSAKMQRKMTEQRRANRDVVDVGSKFNDSHITHDAVLRVAKKEGGTFKGSKPADMQFRLTPGSQLDKDSRAANNKTKIRKAQPPPHSSLDPQLQFLKPQAVKNQNFDPVTPQQPGSKPRTYPPSPTQQPTPFLSHRPLKATPVPRKRSSPPTIAAEALRLSLINLKRKARQIDTATPSAEKAFQRAFATINAKLKTDPTQLRMPDVKLLRRAEKRARGIVTGSLGFTARVERVVQENYKEHRRLRRAAKDERARLRRAAKEEVVVP